MAPPNSDGSLLKYQSTDTFDNAPVNKRTFTLKSAVSESHARTVAAIHAPPAPPEINNWRAYLTSIIVCLGAVAYGYDTGFFGGTLALDSFKRRFGTDVISKAAASELNANLVSLFQAGSFFGAMLQYEITQRLGRKWSIIVSNVIFIASAIVQVFANGSTSTMMGGRFMGGFAIGISSLAIPVYLSEFAPAPIRGRLVGFFDIGNQFGTLSGFWVNYGLQRNLPSNDFQWKLPFGVQIIPAGLLAIGMFFVDETPRFLMYQGKFEEAEKVLCRVRNLPPDHEYLRWELAQTRADVEALALVRGNDTTWDLIKQLFCSKGHRKRLGLGLGLIGFKTFSGIQAVNYYSPRIFEQLGFVGTNNSLFATGIYGTVKCVCTLIFGLFIVDRIGRRRPLLFNSIAMPLCLFFIGGYLVGVGPRTGDNKTAGDYVAIAAIFLFAALYCFGWNSVPLTLISEIFTMRFKTLSMTVCMMWQWLCTFAIVRIMPLSLTNIGARTYFIFGSIFFSGFFFIYFFIPETKSLPLEAMDHLFGEVERTDVEKAIEGYGDGKPIGETSHHEHAGYATAIANSARTNEVNVMGVINEDSYRKS